MNNELKKRVRPINESNYFSIKPPIPVRNFLVEISNSCNNKCIFCANRKMTRQRGYIKPDLLKKILNDAYNEGVREVGFYTTGEPLLNDSLYDYIRIAKSIGYTYIYITTNGILANLSRMKLLINAGLNSIKFSINACSSSEYKFINGSDNFNIVIRNLKEVYNYKKSSGSLIRIFVSYIATKYTYKTEKEIKTFFKHLCDDVLIVNVRNQSGLVPEIEHLYINDKHFVRGQRQLPCFYPFFSINVSYEGYLSACCSDFQNFLSYADLNKINIREGWNNSIIRSLRQKNIEKNVEGTLCYNCIYNVLEKPKPLNSKLSTDFNEKEMFNSKLIEQRIAEFLHQKGETTWNL